MRQNYLAWRLNPEDFYTHTAEEDQLRFLLNFAVLAPSSHNSQPWSFSIENNVIIVKPDFARSLLKSDVNNRQLYISLGCAITNILIAADYYNYDTNINYIVDAKGVLSCAIHSSKRSANKTASLERHLISSITIRSTNRNKYLDTPIPKEFIETVKILYEKNIEIIIIENSELKEQIADLIVDAGIFALNDVDFREELSNYLKPNATKSFVGMPGFGFGIPTPISLLFPKLIKYFNLNRLSNKSDRNLLKKYTPAFIIIATKEDSPRAWVEGGKLFQRISLMGIQNNLHTAPMAAPIQIGTFYKDLQKILKIDLRPQVFFRIGFSHKITPHSPRIPLSQLRI